MFGLSGPVRAGLITGFMQQGLRRDHMKAVAEAEAAAAAKKAKEERELQKIKDIAANQRTLATTQATMRAAQYKADATAQNAHNRLQFDMLQAIPELSSKGVFSLEAKDHFEKDEQGNIIPITPWFKLYFNKRFPKQSVELFTYTVNKLKERKKINNPYIDLPEELQTYYLLKQKDGEVPQAYYKHIKEKAKANTKLTTLEANYIAYVEDTQKFNRKTKDPKEKKSILPFEYWLALSVKRKAGAEERKNAQRKLSMYVKGEMPVSLIYVDNNADNKQVHPHLVNTLTLNDMVFEKHPTSIDSQIKKHAKNFYQRYRQVHQHNTKVTGRMHITEVSGASDMLRKLMQLGLFGKAGDNEQKRLKNIKESGTYPYIVKLLDAMSKGVKSTIGDHEVTTYYNLPKRLGKSLQILKKYDPNIVRNYPQFFNQEDETHYTDSNNPEDGTVVTDISRGKLGDESVRKLHVALQLEQNNDLFKRFSSYLKLENSVGLEKEELLEAYRYYFPVGKPPRDVGDKDDAYVRSQRQILENPFLTIISPYLSGFGNFLEHKSELSTVRKRLKSIKYPKGTAEGRKIDFWQKRDKLKKSQDDIFQLIDTTLTYAGSLNDEDIRDSSLNELISTLNDNNWNVATGIGADLFQSVSDTLKGIVGLGRTYATEIGSLRRQISSEFLNNTRSMSNLARTDIEFQKEAKAIKKARDAELGNNPSEKIKQDADRRFAIRSIILFNKVQLTYKLAGLVQGDQTGGRTISNQDFDTVWKHLWGRSDLSNLANLKALRTDIDLRRKLGDAFDVVYEFEGEVSGTLRRAANEIHHDQTQRSLKSYTEHAAQINDSVNERDDRDSILELNGILNLSENDALQSATIANGKIANIKYGPSVSSINNRMLKFPDKALTVPQRFVNSALFLATLKDNPESLKKSGLTNQLVRASVYNLGISAGMIYGTPEILDSEFAVNDFKTIKGGKKIPIFKPSLSTLHNRIKLGDMRAFDELLAHMKSIDFSNNNNNKDNISLQTLNSEKLFLIELLENTRSYFNRKGN